jgi:hypothetical protein
MISILFQDFLIESKMKKLYAYRPLVNVDDLKTWAKEQGFKKMCAPSELHTTIMYSKKAFDWGDLKPQMTSHGILTGHRSVEPLGKEGAVVLKFSSPEFQKRWKEMLDAGASYDYDTLQPHITITYKDRPVYLDKIIPYDGVLVFGTEHFEDIDNRWHDKVEEIDL